MKTRCESTAAIGETGTRLARHVDPWVRKRTYLIYHS
jgi:hypothetical protein